MPQKSDINIKSQSYWEQRSAEIELSANAAAKKSLVELEDLFKATMEEMNAEINRFYEKYGTVDSSPTFRTLSDGTKVISGYSSKLSVRTSEAYKKIRGISRILSLQKSLTDILKNLANSVDSDTTQLLTNIAEDTYGKSLFAVYNGVGIGRKFSLLSENTIRTLLKSEVNGKNFSERVWDNTEKLADVVNQTLRAGIAQGLSNTEMSKRLAVNMGSGLNVAKALMRTESNNVMNQATLLGYQDSGIVDRYEFIAALDSRTSSVCRALDSKVFELDQAVVGLNYPPMHTNCRSTTIPKFDDADKLYTRIARDDFGDSFVIPAGTTYEEYLQMK